MTDRFEVPADTLALRMQNDLLVLEARHLRDRVRALEASLATAEEELAAAREELSRPPTPPTSAGDAHDGPDAS